MTNAYIFQHNRITTKLSFSARASHYGYYPLVRGNTVPAFRLKAANRIFNEDRHELLNEPDIKLDDLLADSSPLVIAFYTPGNQRNANLLFFESLQESIVAKKGKLLILTSMGASAFSRKNKILNELQIFHDSSNAIAKAFGLYDPQNPLWNWVPGIDDANAFLPAFYVISTDKQIIYHKVDYNFSLFNEINLSEQPFVENLLKAVETAADAYYPVLIH